MADYQSLERVHNIFVGRRDMFSGLTIDLTTEEQNYNDEKFANMLKESLVAYKRYGVRGVWLKIPIHKSSFVPISTEHGFEFHHCFPLYIVMTKWLPDDEPNKLPTFATSSIGVGALVLKDDGKLLVVKEKFSDADHWEIPGGMADWKEDLRTAAKREVLEETGIETEFVSLVCFRHAPDFQFECSDLYFICLLKPLTTEIKRDPTEISHAKWMDVSDVLNSQIIFEIEFQRHFHFSAYTYIQIFMKVQESSTTAGSNNFLSVQLDEFLSSPIVNDENKFFAQAYKDQNLMIVPTDMLLLNKDFIFYSMKKCLKLVNNN